MREGPPRFPGREKAQVSGPAISVHDACHFESSLQGAKAPALGPDPHSAGLPNPRNVQRDFRQPHRQKVSARCGRNRYDCHSSGERGNSLQNLEENPATMGTRGVRGRELQGAKGCVHPHRN